MPHRRFQEARSRYARLCGTRPTPPGTLGALSDELGLTWPDEFSHVCEFFDGTGLTTEDMAVVASGEVAGSVGQLTKRFREELALPKGTAVLGAAEESVLLLHCDPVTDRQHGQVFRVERSHLAEWVLGNTLVSSHFWPNFVVFFEDVLAQEEVETP